MTDILVVDDYVVQQRVLRQVLSSVGYRVTAADDGLEALGLLEAMQYALVILDLAMPEMDGIELLSYIRSNPSICDLPVIILSASGEQSAKNAAWRAGANVFLTKPASSYEIIATVQSLIGTPV